MRSSDPAVVRRERCVAGWEVSCPSLSFVGQKCAHSTDHAFRERAPTTAERRSGAAEKASQPVQIMKKLIERQRALRKLIEEGSLFWLVTVAFEFWHSVRASGVLTFLLLIVAHALFAAMAQRRSPNATPVLYSQLSNTNVFMR